jgi:hypothetical protein
VGALLNQLVWIDDEVPTGWSPPDCTGWPAGPTKVLLAAAGRFELDTDSAELVARLTRIAALTDLVYWSASRETWRKLFEEAVALSGPDEDMRRADFTANDFVPGADLHHWLEEDNPVAGVVYRMYVHERTPERLVFEIVNETSLRASLLVLRTEIAAPGEYRQLYYIEREGGNTWRFYSLVRLGEARSLLGTSAANYRNRAEAFFRYLAGTDMTREPPAAFE